jgi:hypothetical protein
MYQREAAPPPELKSQIAAQLRRAGFLRGRSRVPLFLAAAAAAIAMVFLMHRPPKPNYILLLYDTPQMSGGSRAEYAAWARQMEPLVVGGEELDRRTVVVLGGTSTAPVAGYFLIRANDDVAAERVARQCPHLRHGGAVVLRRIVD